MSRVYTYDPTTGAITKVDLTEYSRWCTEWPEAKIIGKTKIGECLVSTVFLGIDHSYGEGKDPVLFETMIFWDAREDVHNECTRCCTLREAYDMHEDMVKFIQKYIEELNGNSTRVEMWPKGSDE